TLKHRASLTRSRCACGLPRSLRSETQGAKERSSISSSNTRGAAPNSSTHWRTPDMVDRRINGQPSVYTAVPRVLHPEREEYGPAPLIPEDGATNDTDPRVCAVCGQCRQFMRIRNPAQFNPQLGKVCRACKEGVSAAPSKKAAKPAKKNTRKAAAADDGVPF